MPNALIGINNGTWTIRTDAVLGIEAGKAGRSETQETDWYKFVFVCTKDGLKSVMNVGEVLGVI